jgi:hypothetical protein
MRHDFPELDSSHFRNAGLYANRKDLMTALPIPRGGTISEVGIGLGVFSRFLIETLMPRSFHAFDLFQLHNEKQLYGQSAADIFKGKTHLEFYRAEMQSAGCEVVTHEGPSQQTLADVPGHFFDMIYVDGEHTYENVKADAVLAEQRVKPDGILVFNDYVVHDPFQKADYGVVPVVNELVALRSWKVIGFALQKHLFCDIALAR